MTLLPCSKSFVGAHALRSANSTQDVASNPRGVGLFPRLCPPSTALYPPSTAHLVDLNPRSSYVYLMHWSLASLSRLSNRLIAPPLIPGALDYCWDNHRLPGDGCFPPGREGNCFEARNTHLRKPAGGPRGHSRGRPPC